MALFGRRPRPPAPLRALFADGERVLAMAEDGPAAVTATQFGLWLPVGTGQQEAWRQPDLEQAGPGQPIVATGWRRIGWDQVVKATWGEDGLQVIEGTLDDAGVVTDLPALTLRLAEPRTLPAVVKTRVEASIARWEQVRVPGGTARLVARRRPGADGLVWTARLDSGTPASSEARAVLIGHLERLAALTPEQLFPA
jgi:hypothetical protein